jgi:hypothetical protein
MKYAVEMGSGAAICTPSFIKTGSGIRKLIGGDPQTHRQHDDIISLLLFFQNKESRLKTKGTNMPSGSLTTQEADTKQPHII